MSYDGIVTRCVAEELRGSLIGGKVDKVHQPERNTIIVAFRTPAGTHRLLCSANSGDARCHITQQAKENPAAPPMFCMLLRKHLTGGRVTAVTQHNLDRVITIDMDCYSELGDIVTKSLIVEIMGKHSNIMLTDDTRKILGCVKHVDITTSTLRQILPGLIYEPPPPQDRLNPHGFGPLLEREAELRDTITSISNREYTPTVVFDDKNKPVAFSCVDITQYGTGFTRKHYDSISECVDDFFTLRETTAKLTQTAQSLSRPVLNNLERVNKKLKIHRCSKLNSRGDDTHRKKHSCC